MLKPLNSDPPSVAGLLAGVVSAVAADGALLDELQYKMCTECQVRTNKKHCE